MERNLDASAWPFFCQTADTHSSAASWLMDLINYFAGIIHDGHFRNAEITLIIDSPQLISVVVRNHARGVEERGPACHRTRILLHGQHNGRI
jgi:hypothetical protein